jgi:zinc protease
MSRLRTALFLGALIGPLVVAAQPSTAQDVDRKGITYLPSAPSPLVALRVIFRAGSQDDPAGKEGLAALTASMVAEGGTKDLTYEQILAKLYPMAASVSGDCSKEVTVFSGVVHRDKLLDYEKILTAMIVTPRFAPEDFQRLQNEALEFLSKTLRGGADEDLGKSALELELYRNHPYGHVDAGTIQGLKSITLDDVKAFHKKHYVQAAMSLGIAGGADEAFVGLLRNDLDPLPDAGDAFPTLPQPTIPKGIDVTIIEKPADSTAISIGFPTDVTRSDDDCYALAVATS